MVRFNTDPLITPLTQQELHSLKQRRDHGEFGPKAPRHLVLIVFTIVFILGINAILIHGLVSASLHSPHVSMGLGKFPVVFSLVVVAILALIIYQLFSASRKSRQQNPGWALLARFADANDLRFRLNSADPQYPGLLFDEGRDRRSTFHLYSPTGVLADVGGYQYTTRSGKHSKTHHWHFAAFRLPRRVPHLLLDAKANNMMLGITNLPDAFHSSQRISLGAPFDDHYQLYAPGGYGQDAFYLLPPNVMEALLRAPGTYDIEMIDDWLFCYTQSPQNLTDPETWRLFETIIGGVMGALTPVVNRYRDHHLPAAAAQYGPGAPAQVGLSGTRLRRRLHPAMFISGGLVVAYWLLSTLLRLPG